MSPVRVVTFNILHGRIPGDRVDVGLLGRSCAALDADVLALQEVDVRVPRSRFADEAAAVARATGMRHVFGRAARVGRLLGRYGNALLVRGDIGDVENVSLPRIGHREPRAALLATAVVDARPISVAVTHLSVRAAESELQLPVVVQALARRPLPRLLLGDLNRLPSEVEPFVAEAGMKLVDTTLATFPAGEQRHRIDHVAVDGLDVLGVSAPALPVSDHRPLVVDLEWSRSSSDSMATT